MLKILLVAPNLGLNVTPEVRDLTTLHRVTVLSDAVTTRDVVQYARSNFDVIHFSTHSDERVVSLSGSDYLSDTDILQIARSSRAKLVFFNSCKAGRLAHYLVGHGVPLAVHTNMELEDADAWKFPLAFYDAVDRLGNTTPIVYVRAFEEANDGEGLYGLAVSPGVAIVWATISAVQVVQKSRMSRAQIWTLVAVSIFFIWLIVLSFFSFP